MAKPSGESWRGLDGVVRGEDELPSSSSSPDTNGVTDLSESVPSREMQKQT